MNAKMRTFYPLEFHCRIQKEPKDVHQESTIAKTSQLQQPHMRTISLLFYLFLFLDEAFPIIFINFYL